MHPSTLETHRTISFLPQIWFDIGNLIINCAVGLLGCYPVSGDIAFNANGAICVTYINLIHILELLLVPYMKAASYRRVLLVTADYFSTPDKPYKLKETKGAKIPAAWGPLGLQSNEFLAALFGEFPTFHMWLLSMKVNSRLPTSVTDYNQHCPTVHTCALLGNARLMVTMRVVAPLLCHNTHPLIALANELEQTGTTMTSDVPTELSLQIRR